MMITLFLRRSVAELAARRNGSNVEVFLA